MSDKIVGVILSGGKGSRSGLNYPKQYYKLNDKMIVDYSIDVLSPICDELVIVCEPQYNEMFNKYNVVQSGHERYMSLQNAMEYIKNKYEDATVITHDSARPFIENEMINEMITEFEKGNVLTLSKKATSTYTYRGEIINRDDLYEILTPQIIDINTYFNNNILSEDITDLISYAKINNINIKYHFTNKEVKKITFSDDLK